MKKALLLLLHLSFFVSLANGQCHYVRANSTGIDTVAFTFAGGSFASYGCLPIDPTYWLAGNGMSVTATYVNAQDYPTFRVWGMNDDDIASLSVNGVSYPLNFGTALIAPKVVCGLSPGPDGVAFVSGNVTGANSPALGNYSYNDIQLIATNVTSFTLTGLSGAGWGFAGVLVDCPLGTGSDLNDESHDLNIFPNPVSSQFTISTSAPVNASKLIDVSLLDLTGKVILKETFENTNELLVNVGNLNEGLYIVKVESDEVVETGRVAVVKND